MRWVVQKVSANQNLEGGTRVGHDSTQKGTVEVIGYTEVRIYIQIQVFRFQDFGMATKKRLTSMPKGLDSMISSIPPMVTCWKVRSGVAIRSHCCKIER